MASRWAYEALAVAQFRYNDYEKYFFDANQEISVNSAYRSYLIPEAQTINRQLTKDSTSWSEAEWELKVLSNEVKRLNEVFGYRRFQYLDQLNPTGFNERISTQLTTFLSGAKDYFASRYLESLEKRDSIYTTLVAQLGKEHFVKLEKKYHNEFLADLLMNRSQFDMVYLGEDQLIQKKDPIFMQPYSKIGRAHFYSPFKLIGETRISTFVFNIIFIWLMTIVLYMTLLDNTLKKTIKFFESPRGDEQNPTMWAKFLDTLGVIINTPRVYIRALQIKRKATSSN